MSRHLRPPKYTYIKDNTYYFSRSVPADLRCFYTKPRIIQSLRTNSQSRALTASKVFASKLDDYWLGLRLKRLEVPAAHLLIADDSASDSALPSIEEALELYFSVIGKGRQKLFFTTAQRYIGYLIECLGVRAIDNYSSKDATILGEWLIKKGLSNSSLQRVFSGIYDELSYWSKAMKELTSVFKPLVVMVAILTLVSACTSSAPRIAVDPSSIKDQATYDKDYEGCLNLAKTIDISDEKMMKAIGGAAIGTAAVAGIATAVAGAVFAPAIPFIIAGGLAGGGLWGSSASKEEKQAREGVLTGCLRDKGYKVYGAKSL